MKPSRNQQIQYTVEETRLGTWRRYHYPSGALFAEFKTRRTVCGWPLFHYTQGICPETGVHRVAKGVLAIGKIAAGWLAIGQSAFGGIAIGQLAIGLFFGFGQACTGVFAVGQLALGGLFGLGQAAIAYVAIGQFGYGEYVLAQLGYGSHIWSQTGADPVALAFFKSLSVQISEWRQMLHFP